MLHTLLRCFLGKLWNSMVYQETLSQIEMSNSWVSFGRPSWSSSASRYCFLIHHIHKRIDKRRSSTKAYPLYSKSLLRRTWNLGKIAFHIRSSPTTALRLHDFEKPLHGLLWFWTANGNWHTTTSATWANQHGHRKTSLIHEETTWRYKSNHRATSTSPSCENQHQ
jgi:hypothetical protein